MRQAAFYFGYQKWAKFSDDKKHRLVLYRGWDMKKPAAMVIGLNPSTADDYEDDPTIGFIRRVLSFNGYGQLYMTNLFTMITSHPDKLIHDTNFEQTIEVWEDVCFGCDGVVVFAWGNFETHGRAEKAIELFPNALCFDHLKSGSPRHAMYLPADTTLKKFSINE